MPFFGFSSFRSHLTKRAVAANDFSEWNQSTTLNSFVLHQDKFDFQCIVFQIHVVILEMPHKHWKMFMRSSPKISKTVLFIFITHCFAIPAVCELKNLKEERDSESSTLFCFNFYCQLQHELNWEVVENSNSEHTCGWMYEIKCNKLRKKRTSSLVGANLFSEWGSSHYLIGIFSICVESNFSRWVNAITSHSCSTDESSFASAVASRCLSAGWFENKFYLIFLSVNRWSLEERKHIKLFNSIKNLSMEHRPGRGNN